MRRSWQLMWAVVLMVCTFVPVKAQDQLDASEAEVAQIPMPVAPLNLTISPITITLDTDPGEVVTAPIKVRNNGTEAEPLEVALATFDSGANGDVVIRYFNESDEFKSWLQVDQEQFNVRPGEWKTLTLTFSPPSDAALGYYYAVMVRRRGEITSEEASTVLTGAPAVMVLANVTSPSAVRELQLMDFKLTKSWYEYLPVEFNVTVANTGNIFAAPTGTIFVDSGRQKDIGILSFNPGSGKILPGSQRTYTVAWEDGFPLQTQEVNDDKVVLDDQGNPKYQVSWDFSKANKFRMGKFTAHVIMVYDNGERDIPIESQVSFWVLPWKIMTGLALAGLLMILGIVAIVRMVVVGLAGKK